MDLDLTQIGKGYSDVYNKVNNTMFGGMNKVILILLTLVIVIYYAFFSGISNTQTLGGKSSEGLNILELLLWGVFIFLILINGLQYFLDIDVKTSIKNILTGEPEIDISVLQEKEEEVVIEEPKEEVFHINDNEYTYDDAKAVCKAFGSRLATYDEIEKSYNDGGEWCSYGWTEEQLALYPTQRNTYERLQKTKNDKHSCGRPGINGGYIANPEVRFGANCYGYKPKMTSNEWKKMEKMEVEPISKEEKEFQKKVNSYKEKMGEILVSPFNNNRWSHF